MEVIYTRRGYWIAVPSDQTAYGVRAADGGLLYGLDGYEPSELMESARMIDAGLDGPVAITSDRRRIAGWDLVRVEREPSASSISPASSQGGASE